VAALGLAVARDAHGLEFPVGTNTPLRLDVTHFSALAQRFDARVEEGERPQDHGYGSFVNRLNTTLSYGAFTFGTRLDAAVYWRRPADQGVSDPALQRNLVLDGTTRFRDAIYPAKLWLAYAERGVEVTLGDAYAQLGRGLVLSARKIDDLGIDTTIRGVKVSIQKDPFAAMFVAGIANPSRIDDASSRSLFLPVPAPGETRGPEPLLGRDAVVAGELVAGRGLPVVLSTQVAHLQRCAPYAYNPDGSIEDRGPIHAELVGACDDANTSAWLSTLPISVSPTSSVRELVTLGQSMELPRMGKLGSLYLGVATQRGRGAVFGDTNLDGNALYATYVGSFGPWTLSGELKSYRNFYNMGLAVQGTRAPEFSNLVVSQAPTAEVVNQDSAFGFFNACVDGGRLRSDVRLADSLLLFGQGIYAFTKSEKLEGGCDRFGNVRTSAADIERTQNRVLDATAGAQWDFDRNRSYLYAFLGARDDRTLRGDPFYNEQYAQYTFSKYLGDAFLGGGHSIELQGRHRVRFEENQNLRGDDASPVPWVEGENYTAWKIAPKWVLSTGVEYTTRLGLPTWYFNGGTLYRFTQESNVRLFVGQQRGGLRCVNGVCRQFPPFEGARLELTLRF
jgi:hypothetical protein